MQPTTSNVTQQPPRSATRLRNAQAPHTDRLSRHLHRLQQARHQRRRKQLGDFKVVRTGQRHGATAQLAGSVSVEAAAAGGGGSRGVGT